VNRDPERGAELVELVNNRTDARAGFAAWDKSYRLPEEADIIVNATSIGLFPNVDARLDIDLETCKST
jgi:shikimate dehydrogenase